ncbi:hypothetical protein PAMA111031_07485 [Paraphotobacterium marinum]
MKNTINLKLNQKITMTPQLQLAIKLMQLSKVELINEIQSIYESNPLLELNENQASQDISLTKDSSHEVIEELNFNENFQQSPNTKNIEQIDSDYKYQQKQQLNINEYLLWQANLSSFSEDELIAAQIIIDNIDDDAFLKIEVQEIVRIINHKKFNEQFILNVLEKIKHFEPLGSGTSSPIEFLFFQIDLISCTNKTKDFLKELILREFRELNKIDINFLMSDYNLTLKESREILSIFETLSYKPNTSFLVSTDTTNSYITADVTLKKSNNDWYFFINKETIPSLKINENYLSFMHKENTEQYEYLKDNLQKAKWFIKSLDMRNNTLLQVAKSIFEFQAGFFEHGEEAMRPMILNDIAQRLNMHESTISRITTNKFIQTPRGIFELKYFFSSKVRTLGGGNCSSIVIKSFIKKIINTENHDKPFSDIQISSILNKQGLKVARRTVAKYREEMGFLSSSMRKKNYKLTFKGN